jgi:hypothetical protein
LKLIAPDGKNRLSDLMDYDYIMRFSICNCSVFRKYITWDWKNARKYIWRNSK